MAKHQQLCHRVIAYQLLTGEPLCNYSICINAVHFWLPADEEDDIHAEIDEREHELGHALNKAEVSAILKRRGDPVLVAGNYFDKTTY